MKKIVALILAAVILCSCTAALATPLPFKDTFAVMTTKTQGNLIVITLDRPVDKLYANWPTELKVVELAVTDTLQASVYIIDQDTQPGVAQSSIYKGGWVGTRSDRAFVTLQGQWIVSYNRKGEIVDVTSAGAGDIQAIKNAAFAKYGTVSTGLIILNSPQK